VNLRPQGRWAFEGAPPPESRQPSPFRCRSYTDPRQGVPVLSLCFSVRRIELSTFPSQ